MDTEMFPEKITSQVEARFLPRGDFSFKDSEVLLGYEIHMGRSVSRGAAQPLLRIVRRGGHPADILDGLAQPDGRAWGTYVHGIFDNDHFRRDFLQDLQRRSGRTNTLSAAPFSFRQRKEEQFDRLAEHVRKHCDVGVIYRLIGLS